MPAATKLTISNTKTCGCSPNHLNCMSAKDWIKSQLGVWQVYYDGEDIRDKSVHPAVMPVALAKRVIALFTHRGELVLDPFNGIGTTLLAAKDLDRNAVGFDIKDKYCRVTEERLTNSESMNTSKQIVLCDDAHNVSNYLED